ncbi:mitochondrial import inner membrane translocase subunit TIM50 [Artemisia annua]|uniref:Mitochondrial import inner membrane translocase subunit TIM50 n=1 Tax=Artemisia annua TaxID=35608 RepID=A0A2U1Q431_ARTAN|nr:mitochondrial import inner membrane translocase subunit TIM50 [Artemisia annua]
MSIVARRILSILLKRNKNPRLYSTVSANGTRERIVSSSILGEQLASSTPPPEIAAAAGRVGGKPLSFLKYTVLAAFTGGVATAGYATYAYTLQEVDEKTKAFRASAKVSVGDDLVSFDEFTEPLSEKLLPDPHPLEKNTFTLVLDLNETLLYSNWNRDRGWRTFKRPGVNDFLEHLGQFYEIIVYSDQQEMEVDSIVNRLDEKQVISYRLSRPATRYKDGKHYREFTEPLSEKLLPDLHPLAKNTFTLVLDLNETLLYSNWNRDRGWRTFKRPGVNDFLEHVGQFYEIIVYSDQQEMEVDSIVNRLDEKQVISYRLSRPATRYKDGKHYRDLSKLNRDPSRILYLSGNALKNCLQPENCVPLKPWKCETEDTALVDLIPFLEYVAYNNPADIRKVLASYQGRDIAKEFIERTKEYQSVFTMFVRLLSDPINTRGEWRGRGNRAVSGDADSKVSLRMLANL